MYSLFLTGLSGVVCIPPSSVPVKPKQTLFSENWDPVILLGKVWASQEGTLREISHICVKTPFSTLCFAQGNPQCPKVCLGSFKSSSLHSWPQRAAFVRNGAAETKAVNPQTSAFQKKMPHGYIQLFPRWTVLFPFKVVGNRSSIVLHFHLSVRDAFLLCGAYCISGASAKKVEDTNVGNICCDASCKSMYFCNPTCRFCWRNVKVMSYNLLVLEGVGHSSLAAVLLLFHDPVPNTYLPPP